MARTYAGLLGFLAFNTIVLRNVMHQGEVESTIKTACLAMVAWSLLGFLVGWIAERTVVQSVYASFNRRLASDMIQTPDNAKS